MVDAWQRHRFFEGLARALLGGRPPAAAGARQRAVVRPGNAGIPDVLPRPGTDAPLMVAATLRDDDHDGPALDEWIARLRASGALTESTCSPLDAADTARLAEAISTELARRGGRRRCCRPPPADSRCTSSRRCAGSASATRDRLPSGDLAGVLRHAARRSRPRRHATSPGSPPPSGATSPSTCSPRPATWTPTPWSHAVDELWRRPHPARVRRRLRLLPRPAARARLRRGQPARRWLLHRRIAQGLELLHADDTDAVSAQLAEQYARGGRGDRAIGHYRRAAEVAAARVRARRGDPAAPRGAVSAVRALPESRERDRQELPSSRRSPRRSTRVSATPHPSCERRWSARSLLAESLGERESLVTGLVGLWTSQFVQGYIADAHRTAERALELVAPGFGAQRPGALRLRRIRAEPRPPRPKRSTTSSRPRRSGSTHSLSVGTRPDVHGRAFAAHAHWLLGDTDAARASASRSRRHGPGHRHARTASPSRWPTTRSRTRCAKTSPSMDESVAELRELCERYGFAYYREWALVLGGWSRRRCRRSRAGPARHREPERPGRVAADAVLAVAARRSARAQRRTATARGRPRRRHRRRRRPRRPVVAAGGACACGPRYDDESTRWRVSGGNRGWLASSSSQRWSADARRIWQRVPRQRVPRPPRPEPFRTLRVTTNAARTPPS